AKVARKAEKCYHFEIGDTDMDAKSAKTFIKGSGVYWDGLHSGLLAGEKLLADLHAMEVAYLENDRNELEITRPVSLKEIVVERRKEGDVEKDVFAIEKLISSMALNDKKTRIVGSCEFELTRDLFVDDFIQSHKFERIHDVRLKIFCEQDVQLNAELVMDSNTLFINENTSILNRIGVQNVATSTAALDCGKFDFDFKTDKFRPFEGGGIESSWKLFVTGPANLNPNLIKDVVIFISYSARNF
ncbi:MAG: hypothetical protein J6Y14_05915, partial [Fibrobacter sp.]|nr:hypothetical protein [Fibrobacter sp.]